MAKFNMETKNKILNAYKPELSHAKIANLVGVSKTTVMNVLREFKKPREKLASGRQNKLSLGDEKFMVRRFEDKEFLLPFDAVNWAQSELGICISVSSVRSILKRHGINSYKKLKKPDLSPKNIKARLAFAQKHRDWDFVDWQKVLFSDESKYNLYGSDGNDRVWCRSTARLDAANIQATKKFGGGNVMVWGIITPNGVGKLLRVSNKINSSEYCSTLYHGLIGTMSEQSLKPSDFIFQQDNAPCHTSKETKSWLNSSKVRQMEWPANSPDLNPIENVWNYLNKRVRSRRSRFLTQDQLWIALEEEWYRIPKMYISKLYFSMTARIEAVLKARGHNTKY